MQIVESDPLSIFLSYFMKSREAGLLIAENRLQLAKAHAALNAQNIFFANSWQGALRQLALDEPVASLISYPFSREFYEIVQQYQRRAGMIQIMDRDTLDLITVHCNPHNARLLLVVEATELEDIEEQMSLRNEVGMTQIL